MAVRQMSGVQGTPNDASGDGLPALSTGPENGLAMARSRWLDLHDELLRGVTHALSNRIATLSASAYMLEFEDVSCSQAAESLRQETDRMDSLLQLLRLLPSRDDAAFEPVVAADVVEQAVALHAHHCDLRDVVVEVRTDADVLPVWVEPHTLMQALLLALSAAKRTAFPHMLGVQLHVHGDADVVRFSVYPDAVVANVDTLRTALDAGAADRSLQSALGSAQARADGGCELTLPTLPAARRAGR